MLLSFLVNWPGKLGFHVDSAARTSLRRIRALGIGLAVGLVAACGAGRAEGAQELVVSGAISLRDVLAELRQTFERRHPGILVRLNLGASGMLEKQIEAGAPVDVFLSAGTGQMAALAAGGLIRTDTHVVFATNALVVVEPAGSRRAFRTPVDLAGSGLRWLAIGNPRTVPAGEYAEESLRRLGLWERLRPRTVFAENVRQALEYVARGDADAGIVYRSDAALGSRPVRVAFDLPSESHGRIRYPGAVLRDARSPGPGRRFLDLLVSPAGQAALVRHGFGPGDRAP